MTMPQLATSYNGICHDRFIIVDQKEIFWTGASLKDAGRLTFAAAKMYPPSEASCEAGSMRGARRSSLDFLIQSVRRRQNGRNTAKALGVKQRQAERVVASLKVKAGLRRRGADKNGVWYFRHHSPC